MLKFKQQMEEFMKYLELAGTVILDENKKILLMHSNTKNLTQWELPGGKLEPKEMPEQTAQRELKEELNINIEIKRYLGFKEFEDNEYILKYHWFLCKLGDEEPKLMEKKFDKLSYFSKTELEDKRNELSSNMKALIHTINIENL